MQLVAIAVVIGHGVVCIGVQWKGTSLAQSSSRLQLNRVRCLVILLVIRRRIELEVSVRRMRRLIALPGELTLRLAQMMVMVIVVMITTKYQAARLLAGL